jgi:transposase
MPRKRKLILSESDRRGLEALVRAGSTEQRIVKRATTVLMAAEGLSNAMPAQRCGCNINTLKLWRNRWIDRGMDGLWDAPDRGRRGEYIGEKEANILAATLERP